MPTRTVIIEITHGEKTCEGCRFVKISLLFYYKCSLYNKRTNIYMGMDSPFRCQACLDDEANPQLALTTI